jgi:hypothetical protein
MRRLERTADRAANTFLRKCKRLGTQIYWVANCGNIGVLVWSLRNQFIKGVGFDAPELDIERCDYYIPKQYNDAGQLIFPVLVGSTETVGLGSRIYDPGNNGKLYMVETVIGDVEGVENTAVYQCTCRHSKYNPFSGNWTPDASNTVEGIPCMIWNTITEDTTAKIFNGYFIDASSNSVALTMPSNPFIGYTVAVRIIDRTNAITIESSDLVEGETVLNIDAQATNSSFWLTYSDPSRGGWIVTTSIS